MIIVRSPLRITLGGGGTDLPSYYREHEGLLVAAAIDRYVYITHSPNFQPGIHRKVFAARTRQTDEKTSIIRLCVRLWRCTGVTDKVGDYQHGRHPGRNRPRFVGQLYDRAAARAACTTKRRSSAAQILAEQACHIEIDRLGEPIGKQDQFIAAYGGVTCFRFNKDDSVDVWPAPISAETLHNLEDGLVMFFHRVVAFGLGDFERSGRQIEDQGHSGSSTTFTTSRTSAHASAQGSGDWRSCTSSEG